MQNKVSKGKMSKYRRRLALKGQSIIDEFKTKLNNKNPKTKNNGDWKK